MFCTKCGAQAKDGAKFCQKCGNPLTAGAAAARPVTEPSAEPVRQSGGASTGVPRKKRSKKLPVIIGAAVLAVVLIVVAVVMIAGGKISPSAPDDPVSDDIDIDADKPSKNKSERPDDFVDRKEDGAHSAASSAPSDNDGYGDHGQDNPSGGENTAYELCYHGIPLTDWIGTPVDAAYDVLGWPDYGTVVDGDIYLGGEYIGYQDGMMLFIDYETDLIWTMMGSTQAIEINGATLDKNRSGLIEILGMPESEEGVFDEMDGEYRYYMYYDLDGYIISFWLDSPDEKAHTFVM